MSLREFSFEDVGFFLFDTIGVMTTARFATKDEITNWNELLLQNPDKGNVFASRELSLIKQELGGYKVRYVIIDDLAVTVLEKQTPPLGRLWYLPKGPGVTTTGALFKALEALRPLARRHFVFAIRVESELPRKFQPTLSRHGMRKASPIIPNPSTITLDITKPSDELLLDLPQKGRHAIRRAQRDGVLISQVPATTKNCKIMYKLLAETAEGQFGIRGYRYFETFWQRFEKAGMGQLFFASYNGEVVAAAYALVFGTKSTYKDGASVRERRVYGASHLLQWHVIEWAQSKGATLHDFCGSPPSDEINNLEHPHHGVGQFKTAFNKTVTDYIGCYDLVINQTNYTLWTRLAERVYRHVYHRRTKDYYY